MFLTRNTKFNGIESNGRILIHVQAIWQHHSVARSLAMLIVLLLFCVKSTFFVLLYMVNKQEGKRNNLHLPGTVRVFGLVAKIGDTQ